jgi:Xaa-Pro aminopeptidase
MSPSAEETAPSPFGPLSFPAAEYAARLAHLRGAMEGHGLDCLLLGDDRTTTYLTGFGDVVPIGSRARPRVLVVGRHGEPAFFVHASTRVCVAEMTWLAAVDTYDDLTAAPVARLAEAVAARCPAGGTLGVEMGQEQRLGITLADLRALEESLRERHGVALGDAAPALWAARMVKSPAEIERLRAACAITARAYDRAFGRVPGQPSPLRPGMTERALVSALEGALVAEGAQATWIWLVSGRGQYNRVDGVIRDRPVPPGDLVFVDMGANVGGYWADFSRACILGGRPTPHQEDMQARVIAATAAGVAAIRPGAAACDVAAACAAEMRRQGITFNSVAARYGHGLGLAVTEPPHIAEHDTTVLREGMVLTVEPATFTDEGMFHAEQIVLVTSTGGEILSPTSQALASLPADADIFRRT